jgi:iron complex outermembrane receptor protein
MAVHSVQRPAFSRGFFTSTFRVVPRAGRILQTKLNNKERIPKMKTYTYDNALKRVFLLVSILVLLASPVRGQEEGESEEEEGLVALSVYEVTDRKDRGYAVTHSIGATRLNLPLSDIAQTVNVFSRELIEDSAALHLDDVVKFGSNMNISSTPVNGQVVVRGTAMWSDHSDGLPIFNGVTTQVHELDFYDRVEVIKGPAGTLYGQHGLGGVINKVSKKPLPERRTELGFMYDTIGQDGKIRFMVDSTGPLSKDKNLAYRVIGVYQSGDLRQSAPDDRESFNFRLQYRFSEKSKIWGDFKYQHHNVQSSGQWRVDRSNNFSLFISPTDNFYENPDDSPSDNDSWLWTGEFGYDNVLTVGSLDWNLRVIGRYEYGERGQFGVGPTGYEFFDSSGNSIGIDERASGGTIKYDDPRINAPGVTVRAIGWSPGRMRWREGEFYGIFLDLSTEFPLGPTKHRLLTYLQATDRSASDFISDATDNLDEAGNSRTAGTPFPRGPSTIVNRDFDGVTGATAVGNLFWDRVADNSLFNWAIQDNISLFDGRLIGIIGTRYDSGDASASCAGGRWGGCNRITDSTNTNWVQKYGVVAKPVPGLSIFYNNSETFRPRAGGVDDEGNKIGNEVGAGEEWGAKLDLFDHRLTITGSYFENAVSNRLLSQGVLDPVTGILQILTIQTEGTTVEGWEIDFAFQPIDSLAIFGAIGWVDNRNELGRRLRGAQLGNNYSVFAKYTFREGFLQGFSAGLGYSQIAERAGDNGNTFTMPGFDQTDLFFGYKRERWSVQFNVLNVNDYQGPRSSIVWAAVFPNDPRHLRLTFRYHF